MKHVALLAFLIVAAISVPAFAQSYTLDDTGGEYTLPSGSKIACITMSHGGKGTAACTMKLAAGDTASMFPATVIRHGKTFEVMPESASRNRAWGDCGADCIRSKPVTQ